MSKQTESDNTKEKQTFPLSTLLNAIEDKDVTFWDRLSPEEQKKVVPFLLHRWLSCNDDALQVYQMNQINSYIWSLYKEPKLLFQCLIASSSGVKHRAKWLSKPPSKKDDEIVKVVSQHFHISIKEASKYVSKYSVEDILIMADDLGYSKEEIDKIKKLYR